MKFLKTYLLPALFLLAAMGCGQAEAKISITTLVRDDETIHLIIGNNDLDTKSNNKTHKSSFTTLMALPNTAVLVEDYYQKDYANKFAPQTKTTDLGMNFSFAMDYLKPVYNKEGKLTNGNVHLFNKFFNAVPDKTILPLECRHSLCFSPQNYNQDKKSPHWEKAVGHICLKCEEIYTSLSQACASNKLAQNICNEVALKPNFAAARNAVTTVKKQKKSRHGAQDTETAAIGKEILDKKTNASITLQKKYLDFKDAILKETHDLVLVNMLLKIDEARAEGNKNFVIYIIEKQDTEKTVSRLIEVLGFSKNPNLSRCDTQEQSSTNVVSDEARSNKPTITTGLVQKPIEQASFAPATDNSPLQQPLNILQQEEDETPIVKDADKTINPHTPSTENSVNNSKQPTTSSDNLPKKENETPSSTTKNKNATEKETTSTTQPSFFAKKRFSLLLGFGAFLAITAIAVYKYRTKLFSWLSRPAIVPEPIDEPIIPEHIPEPVTPENSVSGNENRYPFPVPPFQPGGR